MATVEELRQTLPYPQTYVPEAGRAHALVMERQPGTSASLVLHGYLLCQDWDKRVFFHWRDGRSAHTLEVTRILDDTPQLFRFHANEAEPVTYSLTPVTVAEFTARFREQYERQGSVPDFADDAALHGWLRRR